MEFKVSRVETKPIDGQKPGTSVLHKKMNFRALDVVIISAKDLKQVNLSFKMDVFALTSIQGYNNNLYNSLKNTPIDKDSGSFPMKFLIDVDAAEKNCLTLVIKLKAAVILGYLYKDIGVVHVPVKELLDQYGASIDEMHASYDVRTTWAGKVKGVLDFSFKFGDTVAAEPGYSGYPLLQMQPQEKTSIGCRYCFIKHTNSPKSSYTGCYLSRITHMVWRSHIICGNHLC